MKTNSKKIAVAALAGAGSLLMARSAAHAALTVTWAETANVATQDGTFDKYVFSVTAITGLDNVTGPLGQDAQVLLFEGTFSAGGGGTLVNPGTNGSGSGNWTNFITAKNTQSATAKGTNSPTGNDSSFVFLPNQNPSYPPSQTGNTNGSLSGLAATSSSFNGIHGESKTFTASWSVTPTGVSGNVGGIEPTTNGGKLAVIYVTPGDSVSFSGDYGTYQTLLGNPVTSSETFSTAAATTGGTGHAIISLTAASGGAPANYGSKQGSTMTVTGSAGHYTYANTSFTGVATGYVEAKTFNPTTDEEIYALDVTNGGNQATDAATIAGDINSGGTDTAGTVPASTGVTASTSAPAGTSFPGGPYNLYLTIPSPATGSGDNFLGFDLSQDLISAGGNVANGDVISAAAVVPEPASAAFILVGASGMLLGRKRKALRA